MFTQNASLLSTRNMILAALFAALTAALAYVRVPLPFTPVPITGQTFGLMLAGLLLGRRLGAISQAVYVLMGLVGLPVFAGGTAGLGVLFGPTGGYLFGHIAGAYAVGWLSGDKVAPGFTRLAFSAVMGGVGIVYILGVTQLALVTGMGWEAAIMAGAAPFLVGDALKVLAAATVAQRVASVVQKGGNEALKSNAAGPSR